MPTFLVFNDNNGTVTIEKITWKNPRRIDTWWFGDSPKTARAVADVFPDTADSMKAMEAVVTAYAAAKAAKDAAIKLRIETINQKTPL